MGFFSGATTAFKGLFWLIPLKNKAVKGDANAQYNLGWCYYDGGCGYSLDSYSVLPINRKEAAKWFRLAAEQGHSDAQWNLSVMYERGDGVPQDAAESMKWRQASEESAVTFKSEYGFPRGRIW